MKRVWSCLVRYCMLGLLGVLGGCTGSSAPGENEAFFAAPGHYAAAPLNGRKPRVGLAMPVVQVSKGVAVDVPTQQIAAEQLVWLLMQADRFNLIEPVQLTEMLKSRGQSILITDAGLAHPATIRGIDYLLFCQVQSLSIGGGSRPATVSVARVEQLLHVGQPVERLVVDTAVDLKLVDPASGEAKVSRRVVFHRVASASSYGLALSDNDLDNLHLSEAEFSKVIRIILDDAVRQFLPSADAVIRAPALPATQPAAPPPASSGVLTSAGPSTFPSTRASLAKLRCPECGAEVSADDEFCPNCGARLVQNGVRVAPKAR